MRFNFIKFSLSNVVWGTNKRKCDIPLKWNKKYNIDKSQFPFFEPNKKLGGRNFHVFHLSWPKNVFFYKFVFNQTSLANIITSKFARFSKHFFPQFILLLFSKVIGLFIFKKLPIYCPIL